MSQLAGWPAGWMDGSRKNKTCHAAGARAQKVVSRRVILFAAVFLKQKLEGGTRQHEDAKSTARRRGVGENRCGVRIL